MDAIKIVFKEQYKTGYNCNPYIELDKPYDWQISGDFPAAKYSEVIKTIYCGMKSEVMDQEFNDHLFEILLNSYRHGLNKRFGVKNQFPMVSGNTIYWNKKEKEEDELAETQYCCETSKESY